MSIAENALTKLRVSSKKPALCWDCAKACGDCSWSRHYDRKPIEGWVARERLTTIDGQAVEASYLVIECPEFKRDATGGGQKRVKKEQTDAKQA